MPTVFNPTDRAALERRLRLLVPGSTPAWGRFNCEQMLAHVADALRMALGELQADGRRAPAFLSWPPVRHAIIHWLPFPKGAPTAPELLARPAGTHQQEIEDVVALLERVAANERVDGWAPHPAFGALSTPTWGALVYKHVDHHLRQFRV